MHNRTARTHPCSPAHRCARYLVLAGTAATTAINAFLIVRVKRAETNEAPVGEAVVVLGAKVHSDGTLSSMLEDRLITSKALWDRGAAARILVSGDDSDRANNQTAAMATWLIERGVPLEAVELDRLGLNTYDTMWRARHVFGYTKVLAVSQGFHLARIVWDGQRSGLTVTPISADLREYRTWRRNLARESLVRVKDFALGLAGPPAGKINI